MTLAAPPRDEPSPWISMLEARIDHVIMHLSFTPYSTPAITAIQELAAAHGLVIWDPQSDDVYLPDRAED
jgi:hypothetical protein